MLTGHCLCGAIRYTAHEPPRDPAACHCSQCRRQSGHYWAAGTLPDTALTIEGPVRWFASSPRAKRGFCPGCGSFLFWKENGSAETDISLGALDAPTGLRLARHIHTASKGDYYDIADGLPQEPYE